jgi:hypothetical protein
VIVVEVSGNRVVVAAHSPGTHSTAMS